MAADTPLARLTSALNAATNGGRPGALIAFAREWGIAPIAARRCAKGRVIGVAGYLKICGALALNPVDAVTPWGERTKIGDLDWTFVALALHGQRLLRGDTVAKAKKTIAGISDATISRVENGRECSVEHFLSICRYVGQHPYDLIVSHGKHAVKDFDRKREKATA